MKQLGKLTICLLLILFAAELSSAQKPELVVQTGHSDEVRSVAFSPDGKTLASGGLDNAAKLWDVSTGAELRTLNGHSDWVNSVTFSPDSRILASGSQDSTIKLWDVTTGRKLRTLVGRVAVRSVAFNGDGKTLASGDENNTITLWDVITGEKLRTLISTGASSVAFSPGGALLAGGGGDQIDLWELATGRKLRSFTGHSSLVNSVVFTSDGKVLVSGSRDETVKLWDVGSGRELRTFSGTPGGTRSVAASGDGVSLASGGLDGTIRLWERATGAVVHTIKAHSRDVNSVAFSPDGKTVASASDDQTIKLWDVATGRELRTLARHSHGADLVALGADGKTLAVGGHMENAIKLWDVATGQELRTLNGHSSWVTSIAFSSDGKVLASAGQDRTIKLWDTAAGRDVRTIPTGGSTLVGAVSFSTDGTMLAGGTQDNTIKLWQLGTGRELRTLTGHLSWISSVAFSADGKLLASGSDDKTVRLWEVGTGSELFAFKGHSGSVWSVVFTSDGKSLISSDRFGTVRLWEAGTGRELRQFTGHSAGVSAVTLSADGKTLATGCDDSTIKLWEVNTGRQLGTLIGHSNSVGNIAFSPDARLLFSGSVDTTVKVWEVASGKELASLIALDEHDWIVVTPDGLFDGSPAAWNKIIWRFNNNTFNYAPVEAFFSDFYYPGLLADLFAGKRPQPPTKLEDKDRRQPQVKLLSAEPLSLKMRVSWDEKEPDRLYMRVAVEVTEAPADKDHKLGSGARDVRLFRDGTLVKIWHGDVLGGKDHVKLEADVPGLPDENHFTAYAFNHDNVKSGDAVLTAKGDQTTRGHQPPVRTAYVLAVGVNRYTNARYNLKYAVADAQAFGAEWTRQQKSLKQFQHVEVVSLLDEEATKANILMAIKRLVDLQPEPLPAGAPGQLVRLKYAEPQDAVVIYFAGHGTARGNRFYLIPHDLGYTGNRRRVTEAGLQLLLAHSISDLELEQAFEGLQGGQQVFVIDACNSGQALEAEEKRRGPMNSKGLAQLAYEKGMYILTAAQSYQAAKEAAKFGHGFLTYALVEDGLKRGAADREPKDGSIDLREWLNYATDQVPRMQEENLLEALRGRGRLINFRGDGTEPKDPGKSSVQRPRIFYRRELESNPLVVAILGATAPQ